MAYRQDNENNHLKRKHRMDAKSRSRFRYTGADWFGFVAMCLLVTSSILLAVNLIALQMLPTKYIVLAMILLLIINIVHIVVQLPVRRNKGGKIVCGAVAIILSAVMIYGFVATGSVQSALKNISRPSKEIQTMDVIVLANSTAQTLNDVQGENFGITANTENSTLQLMTEKMSEQIGEIHMTTFDSITRLADGLTTGHVGVIIIDDSYLESLSEIEGYQSFTQQTRIIYQFDIETEASTLAGGKEIDITREPFIVYLSGSDSRSDDINATGRSDVNILAVVNPKSRQILLLNTPRDYYVPLTISNGVKDKLTHAGVYGIDCSMGTLAALYGADVSCYVRINFTGFENIVNALGGVTVHSDYTFSANGFQFVEGDNTLMGDAALSFVRERYSFESGDNQRGKDQMAMIKAVLDKAMSPAILTNYQNLLNAISGSFTTNISYDKIAKFVQMQLQSGTSWNITSYAVSGMGDMCTTYTYPDENLYVMQPDTAQVGNAKTLIQQVLNGEVPQA